MAEEITIKETAGRKRRVPNWLKILAGLFAVIVLAIVVVSLITVPLEGNVNVNPKNEQIYSALVANEIIDVAVDVTTDHVLVSAMVQNDTDAPKVKYIVFGAVSQIYDPPATIIVEVFDQNRKHVETSKTPTSAVQKYLAGDITLTDLENSIQKA